MSRPSDPSIVRIAAPGHRIGNPWRWESPLSSQGQHGLVLKIDPSALRPPRHAGPPPPQGTGSGRYPPLSLLRQRQVMDTGRSLSPAEAGGRHDEVGIARKSIIRAAGIRLSPRRKATTSA